MEEVSYLLKHADTHNIEEFLKVNDTRNYKDVCAQMSDYIKIMKEAFGGKKPGADDEEGGGEEEAVAPVGFVPDLLEESQVY